MIKTEKEAISALKSLSDTLLDLGKPKNINIFDAVGMSTQEIKHSAFLAWLLNPEMPHGLKNKFLTIFLKKLLYYEQDGADIDGYFTNKQILSSRGIFSIDDLHGLINDNKISVLKERTLTLNGNDGRIDIFIESESAKTLIVIENKIFTSTHDDQLKRYVAEFDNRTDWKKIFVYLTPNGDLPYDDDDKYDERWCIFSYETVLDIVRDVHVNVHNLKLKSLMEDYITMVDNKILHNNPTIRALCKKIRHEHSEALEIILHYIDNVDMVYQYIATEWIPRNIPNSCNLIANGRRLIFCTKVVSDFYNRHGLNMRIADGLFRFQISVVSKDGPITIGMWLSKARNDEWSAADNKIREILQPTKRMGEKYCTLYSRTILSVEEREKVFETDTKLFELIDDRLNEFIVKLQDFEKHLITL